VSCRLIAQHDPSFTFFFGVSHDLLSMISASIPPDEKFQTIRPSFLCLYRIPSDFSSVKIRHGVGIGKAMTKAELGC
jgi:hypothetical protein